MNRRLRARLFNSSIGIITAIMVLAFLLDYSNTGSLPGTSTETVLNTRSAYFLVNTDNSEFDSEGRIRFRMVSAEIKHNPFDDGAELRSPHVELFTQGEREWTIDSQLGKISADGSTINLEQRVVVSSEDQLTILRTPQLLIYPNEKLAKTDKPVTLQNPYGFTRAIGLTADMQNQRVELEQQVRGQYQGVGISDGQ